MSTRDEPHWEADLAPIPGYPEGQQLDIYQVRRTLPLLTLALALTLTPDFSRTQPPNRTGAMPHARSISPSRRSGKA